MNDNKVSEYYDDFSEKQISTGVSTRNIRIHEFAIKFGLKKTDNVLEIGCGIGTQTELLAQYITHGRITALDISSKSVNYARESLKKYNNIEFLIGDIVEMKFDKKFDIVILPDVIEHIPLKDHFKLFSILRSLLKDSGFVLIHIPNPNYLKWCQENAKELLQIIDQPIFTDLLCSNVYPNDFYIHYLETYEIWTNNCDYQLIVLKPKSAANNFSFKPIESSFKQKVIFKLRKIVRL